MRIFNILFVTMSIYHLHFVLSITFVIFISQYNILFCFNCSFFNIYLNNLLFFYQFLIRQIRLFKPYAADCVPSAIPASFALSLYKKRTLGDIPNALFFYAAFLYIAFLSCHSHFKRRCLLTSNISTAAATPAFNDSACPSIGILTQISAFSATS